LTNSSPGSFPSINTALPGCEPPESSNIANNRRFERLAIEENRLRPAKPIFSVLNFLRRP
jgi:hypothetical protein